MVTSLVTTKLQVSKYEVSTQVATETGGSGYSFFTAGFLYARKTGDNQIVFYQLGSVSFPSAIPVKTTTVRINMGSLSIWHWLIVFFVISTYVVPVWRIVSKAGYSGAWSFLSFIPVLNFIMLWVFAFSRWPNEKA